MANKPNVLVVEDDKYWIDHHRVALKNAEVNIHGVQTVSEAVAFLKHTSCAVAVVDLEIPGIKDSAFGGFEVLRYARKVNPYTELIVITAHSENEIIERVSTMNIPFLSKPIDHRELSISVTSLLRAWFRRFLSLEYILEGFLDTSTILTKRANKRPPFQMINEYDVQDLMHTIIKPFFPDVVSEEYSLKRAGKTKRLDLVVRGLDTVVETKMVRDQPHATRIPDELDIDIRGYVSHPHCRYLFCYVYDPEHLIRNPREVERDLSGEASQDGITVEVSVLIRPAT